ncbi:hypothetical protein SPWS13_2446 [Shewanella putrefaciens]|nr:hypothetical protein SPWS13_2446 [Shewanella putrefaciens]
MLIINGYKKHCTKLILQMHYDGAFVCGILVHKSILVRSGNTP